MVGKGDSIKASLELDISDFESSMESAEKILGDINSEIKEITDPFEEMNESIKSATSSVEELGENLNSSNTEITSMESNFKALNDIAEDVKSMNSNLNKVIEEGSSFIRDRLSIEEDEISYLRESLEVEEQRRTELTKEISDLEDQLSLVKQISSTSSSKKNSLDDNIIRRTVSMYATMELYNQMMDIVHGSMEASDALQKLDYWENRLQGEHLASAAAVKQLNYQINTNYDGTKSLAQLYPKVNMNEVAAGALEAADKYKLANVNLGELTETYTIAASAFASEGRTQEDSILAVNDAMDGQFKRLAELGIYQKDLMANGWSGDLSDKEGLIKALNKAMDHKGYKKTAQEFTDIGESIKSLKIKLETAFGKFIYEITPMVIDAVNKIMWIFDQLISIGGKIKGALEGIFPSWVTKGLEQAGSWIIVLGLLTYGVSKFIGALKDMFTPLGKAISKIKDWISKLRDAKTAEEEAAEAESTANGTDFDTSSSKGKTSWREGLAQGFEGTAKNLGSLAKVVTTAVAGITLALGTIGIAIGELYLLGEEWEQLKPQAEKGIEAINEVGLYVLALAVPMVALTLALSKFKGLNVTKGGVSNSLKSVAVGMLLVAEGIAMLIPSILAIAIVGGVSHSIGEDNLQNGIMGIQLVTKVLNSLANPVGLLLIEVSIIGAVLVDSGNIVIAIEGIVAGLGLLAVTIGSLVLPLLAIAALGWVKDKLGGSNLQNGIDAINMIKSALIQIERATIGFIGNFMGIGLAAVSMIGIAASISSMAVSVGAIRLALTALKAAVGGGGVTGLISNGMNMVSNALTGTDDDLQRGLENLRKQILIVMNFAKGLGNINKISSTAVTGVTNGIINLKARLDDFINSINYKANQVQNAGKRLGSALSTGFTSGIANFSNSVSNALRNGLNRINTFYPIASSKAKLLAAWVVTGFHNINGKLTQAVNKETSSALQALNGKYKSFYNAGLSLGNAIANGFNNSRGITVSVNRIGGSGIPSNSALLSSTDMSLVKSGASEDKEMLASSSVKGSTKNTHNHNEKKTQVFNFNFDGATFYGDEDMKNKMKQFAEEVFYKIHSTSNYSGI